MNKKQIDRAYRKLSNRLQAAYGYPARGYLRLHPGYNRAVTRLTKLFKKAEA